MQAHHIDPGIVYRVALQDEGATDPNEHALSITADLRFVKVPAGTSVRTPGISGQLVGCSSSQMSAIVVLRRSAAARANTITREQSVPPEIVERPPRCVFRFDSCGNQHCTVDCVTALLTTDVSSSGPLRQKSIGETFDL